MLGKVPRFPGIAVEPLLREVETAQPFLWMSMVQYGSCLNWHLPSVLEMSPTVTPAPDHGTHTSLLSVLLPFPCDIRHTAHHPHIPPHRCTFL